MKLIKLIVIFICLFNIYSCSNKIKKRYYNELFVKKFYNKDFIEFKNFLIRISTSNDSLKLVDIYNNKDRNYVYRAFYDINQDSVYKFSISTKDTFKIDENSLNKLIYNFIKLKINYLEVDSFNNVFINLFYPEHPNLVKIQRFGKYEEVYKDWNIIRDNWYQE